MPALDFNPSAFTPTDRSFSALPPGKYQSVINNAEIKITKAGDGEYLEIEMQITEGQYAGRKIWERLNISNPNKKAEDIAKERLSQLCLALNIAHLTDTDQLVDCMVVVALEDDRKEPGRNRVVGFYAADGVPAAPALAPAAAAPAARSAMPWKK